MKTSAGVMLYKKETNVLKVFLVHSGGPFWANKDLGTWSIPKGEVESEDIKDAAIREVCEELGIKIEIDKEELIDLGSIEQRNNKTVYGFGFLSDLGEIQTKSNNIYIEWPPRSGKQIEIPEVDRGEWFDLEMAAKKINPQQVPFIERLKAKV